MFHSLQFTYPFPDIEILVRIESTVESMENIVGMVSKILRSNTIEFGPERYNIDGSICTRSDAFNDWSKLGSKICMTFVEKWANSVRRKIIARELRFNCCSTWNSINFSTINVHSVIKTFHPAIMFQAGLHVLYEHIPRHSFPGTQYELLNIAVILA